MTDEKPMPWSIDGLLSGMTAEEREAAYWAGPGCEEDDRG